MKEYLAALDRSWFGRGSPSAFGLLRIFIAALCLVTLFEFVRGWDDWMANDGFISVEAARAYNGSAPRLDAYFALGDGPAARALLGLTILAGVFTLLGLWTRVSSLVLALGMVFLHNRVALLLHGGDVLLRVAALYVAVGPAGQAFSLDRLIGLRRGTIEPGPVLAPVWPQKVVAFNLALIYITTVWAKMLGSMWPAGTATYYTARLESFQRVALPDFLTRPPMTAVTTYGTLFVEFLLGTLVFLKPYRTPIVVTGLLLHATIDLTMTIPIFSYAICSLYICWYDGEEIESFFRRFGIGRTVLRTFRMEPE